ncbi:peptidylprolyl isomerase [Piscinibacter sp. HJYY11]|uniref:peptidylprolyl isomerase n=1 Tax=Piscinibacter sp. HJYY11 TaxID=2801333 RepID=UPI00191ED3DD|nr:peptidylprolyl isomerase [Piscinibacter sp. HJYY11]MBL0726870.1 peptidylprolyl isomerase [Piscinibacter sp. HJYY11]
MNKLSNIARASLLVVAIPLLHGCAEPGKSKDEVAGNVAIVNGKAVPKTRVDVLLQQATRGGQPKTPELEAQVKDEVVLREMFMQEAEKRGLARSPDYKAQMELARQSILIRELFNDFNKNNPVTDAEIKAEYDKFKAQAGGAEYHARHILVEKEDEAKDLIKALKAGAKFDELAKKHSKDQGSGANGGDLDWAAPDSYVPEFAKALSALKKGELTETPVKTQYGYHIIKLEDTREAQFPSLEEVKPRIQQGLVQQKLTKYRDDIKSKAKTDYKFTSG